MDILTAIGAQLAQTDGTCGPGAAAGVSFELIRHLANGYADLDSEMFATWTQVAIAACEARNTLRQAPVAVNPDAGPGDHATEDHAAHVVADLAVTIRLSLQKAARLERDRRQESALRRAAGCASQIEGLLAAGALWNPSPTGR